MSVDDQPRILKRHEIVYDEEDDYLGSGRFGVVYRCCLTNSSEVVAVKVLATPHRLRKSDLGDFIREANILQGLTDCPYVIRFLGLCIDPGHHAIVMEYVEYGTLEEMLFSEENNHPIIKQWDCRIRMALEIAKGMDYLHSLPTPIIHRDLKTANVLVGNNYSCKIIDFGLAKLRDISTQTSTGNAKGTVAFIAPEVFDGTVKKGKEMKLDVYSYAIVLWQLKEMIDLPFDVIRVNVLAGQRPVLRDDDCIQGYKDIIVRCWDGQPDCRLYFREIVTMLDGIMSQMAVRHSASANQDVAISSSNVSATAKMPLPDADVGAMNNLGISVENRHKAAMKPVLQYHLGQRNVIIGTNSTASITPRPTDSHLNRIVSDNQEKAPWQKWQKDEISGETLQWKLESGANRKCTDQEIVIVARTCAARWQELVCVLQPSVFSTSEIAAIQGEYRQLFLQARVALEKWTNALCDKAIRQSLIKAMCRVGLRAQASQAFGHELVNYVSRYC
ncbi:probable serine/threonine-protein kinase DDB_G0271682 isoform X2 [Corticium candelabrum]|uniref:probable serine/threonine-protein kinase DDB_G0271682 isoform X2 n=1 Tax=Corticium candelabrum TaxID=121492 RepID=UPI002E267ACE|nr:probable serine/threonine-protein kinase DDB_G0271682 isoform X2 [Corticium candelabrum]